MTRKAIHRRTGDIVTPEEFLRREGAKFRERGIYPKCIVCGSVLHPYGLHSTNVTSRFDHPNRTDCLLSSTPDPRFAYLQPTDWDLSSGKRLRATLCDPENIKQAYAVARRLCFSQLKVVEFLNMCHEADRKSVWAYKGLEVRVIPYILVTLVDLAPHYSNGPGKGGRKFPLRFVLHKPVGSAIDAMWVSPNDCRLEPVFADSGRPMKNPTVAIFDRAIETARNNVDWIPDSMTESLQECCIHR